MNGVDGDRSAASYSAAAPQTARAKVQESAADRPNIVRVEANFLRLPLFALDKKHMKTMDGIHCEGTFRRGGQVIPFSFSATRNVDTYYPGPTSRAAHFALLSMATDLAIPIQNPIVFTWHELCARMQIQCSGRAVQKLRRALLATKGLVIRSHHALYSKADDWSLSTDDLERVINLYDQLEFFGSERHDGSTADINALWLSRWYLDNLNALYSAPLDFGLWRTLNDESLIASRLYEFLFLKFYAGYPQLRFNYATLVKFIPVRTERYLSDARKQLGPALDLLVRSGVLAEVQWLASSNGSPQLLLHQGPVLSKPPVPSDPIPDELSEEDFVATQVQEVQTREANIVVEFHRLFGHDDYRPARAELALARELITHHGYDQLQALLPILVNRIRLKWPDAKTFVSVSRYVGDVAAQVRKQQLARERTAETAKGEQAELETRALETQQLSELRTAWATLPDWDKEAIRAKVLMNQPASAMKFPKTVDRWCLQELKKRLQTSA